MPDTETSTPPPAPCSVRAVSLARALLFLLFLGQLLAFAGIKGEDCFITFRYARNLAEGRGLVYNPGEYVEGISNPYWALCNAALYALGMAKGLACTLLIFLHAVAGWWVLARVAREWFGRGSWLSVLPLLPVACMTALPAGFQNGLEGSAVFLGASLLCAGIALERPAVLAAGVFLLLGNRPEAPAFAALAVVWLGWEVFSGRLSWKRGLVWAGVILGMVVAMVVARWAYYGDIVPNTLRAKGSVPLSASLRPGLAYAREYVWVFGPWMLPLAALPLFDGKRRAAALFLLLAAGGNAVIVVRNGGDWMAEYRLLTPYYGIIALLAAAGAAFAWRRGGRGGKILVAAALATGCLFSFAPHKLRESVHSLGDRFVLMGSWETEEEYFLDNHVDESLLSQEPDDLMLAENGGFPPFLLKSVPTVELFGLTDRGLVLREDPCTHRVPAGGIINWHGILANRRPTFLLLHHEKMGHRLGYVAGCPETAPLLDRYVAALNTDNDRLGSLFVRNDRKALAAIIRDYGAFVPAGDLVRFLQEHPDQKDRVTPDLAQGDWMLPPWRSGGSGEPHPDRWREWDRQWRYCAPLSAGADGAGFVKDIFGGGPLLVIVDVPPGTPNRTPLRFRRMAADGTVLREWAVPLEDFPFPEDVQRCHYGYFPEETPGTLTLEMEGEGTVEVGVFRWPAGPPPKLPEPHTYPDLSDLRAALVRFDNDRDRADGLTEHFLTQEDTGELVRAWTELAARQPLCPMKRYFLARALENAGRAEEALEQYRRVQGMDAWPLRLPRERKWQAAFRAAAVTVLAATGLPDYSYRAAALCGEAGVLESRGEEDAAITKYLEAVYLAPESYDAFKEVDRIYSERGRLDELERLWLDLTAAHPRSRQAWFCLGLARERRSLYDPAVAAYERALALAADVDAGQGTSEALGRVLCAKGKALLDGGRAEEALACFDRANGVAGALPCAKEAAGRALELLGRLEEAAQAHLEAIALAPDAHGPYAALDRIHAARRDPAGAERMWREMTAEHPERRHAWFWLGVSLETLGRPDAAVDAYERALQLSPDGEGGETRAALARALCAWADGVAAENRLDEALTLYRRACALDGSISRGRLGEARVLELQGRLDDAKGGFLAALELDPELYDAYAALDRTHAAEGRIGELEDMWTTMTAAHPERRHAWFCLGLARERGRKYAEAVRAYEETLRLAPPGQEAPPRAALARALCAWADHVAAENRLDEALTLYRRACALDGSISRGRQGEARVLELQGRLDDAKGGFLAALELDPELYDAYAALDRTHAAEGRIEELEDMWAAMTVAHPERRHAWFCLGLARERGRKYAEAVRAYGEALRLAPPGQEAPPREAINRARRAAEAAGR